MTPAMHADLRKQALAFRQTGPHAHNRKPIETTMRDLRVRRWRRRGSANMRQVRDLFTWGWEQSLR